MKCLYFDPRKTCALLVLVMSLLLVACNGNDAGSPSPDAGMVTVDWLLYEEQEQGTGQYPVRILVNRDFMRFDDNFDASDFLLLDRHARKLFSVSHEERSILVIEASPGDTSLPADIILREERNRDSKAPGIAGSVPLHVQFRANDVLCYEAVVIPGLLKGLTDALTEYAQLLGLHQLASLDMVPGTLQTPCFLSRYVYRPARHFIAGLPVREWDDSGYLRTLVDYGEQLKVSRSLFNLPGDYEQFQVSQGSPGSPD